MQEEINAEKVIPAPERIKSLMEVFLQNVSISNDYTLLDGDALISVLGGNSPLLISLTDSRTATVKEITIFNLAQNLEVMIIPAKGQFIDCQDSFIISRYQEGVVLIPNDNGYLIKKGE